MTIRGWQKRHQLDIPFHRGSETFSFWSHGISMLAAIGALVWMAVRAESAAAIAAYTIYGASMVLLFFSSTLHHAVQSANARHRSGFLRRLDHISIYLFIAGSYTPVCILGIGGAWGISILSVVGGVALVGVMLRLFAPFTPRWITASIYVALGWVAVVGVKPLVDTFSVPALMWLLAGGVVYTVGAIGYARHKPDLWPQWLGAHGVWHVMVMIAAALQFVFMVRYLPVA